MAHPEYSTLIEKLLDKLYLLQCEQGIKIINSLENLSKFIKYDYYYYDVSNTITTAAASNPNDFDSSVYNVEPIYKELERYSKRVIVKNDGSVTLFILISHSGTTKYSHEVPIYAGESKIYHDVYEIRLRSTVAGHAYRVTEYEIESTSNVSNRSDFIANSFTIALANTNTQVPLSIIVPNGFALVFRAHVSNTGLVYISRTDATNTTLRNTLNAGDTVKLYIINSNLIFAAVSVAGERIDLLVEQ